jgi:hypothetical protein
MSAHGPPGDPKLISREPAQRQQNRPGGPQPPTPGRLVFVFVGSVTSTRADSQKGPEGLNDATSLNAATRRFAPAGSASGFLRPSSGCRAGAVNEMRNLDRVRPTGWRNHAKHTCWSSGNSAWRSNPPISAFGQCTPGRFGAQHRLVQAAYSPRFMTCSCTGSSSEHWTGSEDEDCARSQSNGSTLTIEAP